MPWLPTLNLNERPTTWFTLPPGRAHLQATRCPQNEKSWRIQPPPQEEAAQCGPVCQFPKGAIDRDWVGGVSAWQENGLYPNGVEFEQVFDKVNDAAPRTVSCPSVTETPGRVEGVLKWTTRVSILHGFA